MLAMPREIVVLVNIAEVDERPEIVVPTADELKQGHHGQGGGGQRNHDAQEYQQFGRAVHVGRVRQFDGQGHQKLSQQENEERTPQEDGQDQRVVGVEPVKVAEYQVQGNEGHEVRQDHRGQHDGEDVVAPGPLDAGGQTRRRSARWTGPPRSPMAR